MTMPTVLRAVKETAPVIWLRQRRDAKAAQVWSAEDELRKAFYARFVSPGELVFDLGANLGNRSKVFRRLGATVVALEPQPYCQGVLTRMFAKDDKFRLVPCAVSSEMGTAEMLISPCHVISSLSKEWLEAAQQSRRFEGESWNQRIQCKLTTVEALIEEYGVPSFIKIDVEGYEPKVIAGMRSPVRALSFEFTRECLSATLDCLDALQDLGMLEFNCCEGEAMEFLTRWLPKDEMKSFLLALPGERLWGDVYARSAPAVIW